MFLSENINHSFAHLNGGLFYAKPERHCGIPQA